MKILLSYSKQHFDPEKPSELQRHWGSSASILARNLFEILSSMGSVTYIDRHDFKKLKGQEFDLFIGIPEHFCEILDICKIKKSILFAVNMHPLERNKILKEFMRREKIGKESLAGYEFIDELATTMAIEKANFILCVGNNATYNSYITKGVPKNKIKILNYATLEQAPLVYSKKEGKRYLFTASEIGLRKGFDIVYGLFSDTLLSREKIHLDIIGNTTTERYAEKIAELKKILGDKMTFHKWIDSKEKKYKDIISKCDFLVFPSLEEGQAGTALEAMALGVIPIISENTGVDFSPIGLLELKIDSERNRAILREAQNMSPEKIKHLKEKTLEYYAEFHIPFKENLRRSIEDCLSGKLYPKVSIVISLFNKEKTAYELIKRVYTACHSYGNTEIQIIFDGCKDATEKIVRDFFLKKPDQEITYHNTPDIFEIKTNNIGLKASSGRYTVIIQDDNFIYDKNFIFEAALFFEKNPKAAILGGLAGVNFYPRGTLLPQGKGQQCMDKNEVYWRQDETTDPELLRKVFEVDACMRGPLFIRKSFLETNGYLDEIYAPLYQDDMDICFRAREKGFKTYCMLMDVENTQGTMANYNSEKANFFKGIIERNTSIFYSRHHPSTTKDYLSILRIPLLGKSNRRARIKSKFINLTHPLHKSYNLVKRGTAFMRKNIIKEGPITGSRKILSRIFRELHKQSPRIQYHALKVARKIYSAPEDLEIMEREKREAPWWKANGDRTLRITYPALSENSIVFDLGGYHGNWAAEIYCRYGSTIHIFEPVKEFASTIRNRFIQNKKIHLHEFGIGPKTETAEIFLFEGGTSLIKKSSESVRIEMKEAMAFFREHNIESIDLMKINIEGAEYDLLDYLIENKWISRIKNIQIQFHNFAPDAVKRRNKIREALSKTHRTTYEYEFVWENWEKMEK